jgi:molybdopterin/thiamine biosynthesis adenylyltransferase
VAGISAPEAQGATALDMTEEDFYAELTTRNTGVVSADEQQRLRNATILVAGCGSIGGAAVEPLVRLGVRSFLLADPGTYELNNLNRQSATFDDIERNKAAVAASRVLAINPHAKVAFFEDGVGEHNVEELTSDIAVIVDGIDVTTMDGWRAKHLLHRYAVERRLPLVTGWDIAGAQYVRCYDYRTIRKPFDGAISKDDIERLTSWQLLLKAIPLRYVPLEMFREVRDNLGRPDYSFPQVTYVALAFGAITSHLVVRLAAGDQVRSEVYIDIHQQGRPFVRRTLTRINRLATLASLAPKLIKLASGRQAN